MKFLKKLIWGETLEIQDDFFGKLTAQNVKKNNKQVDWQILYNHDENNTFIITITGNIVGIADKSKNRIKRFLSEYESNILPQIKNICSTEYNIGINEFNLTNIITFDKEAIETIFAFSHEKTRGQTFAATVYFTKGSEDYKLEIRKENVHF